MLTASSTWPCAFVTGAPETSDQRSSFVRLTRNRTIARERLPCMARRPGSSCSGMGSPLSRRSSKRPRIAARGAVSISSTEAKPHRRAAASLANTNLPSTDWTMTPSLMEPRISSS